MIPFVALEFVYIYCLCFFCVIISSDGRGEVKLEPDCL